MCEVLIKSNSNQIFHYTRCITPLATWAVGRTRAVGNTVSNLNLWPPAPETNALQLDQLAGYVVISLITGN